MFKDSVKCVPRKFPIKFQEFSRMFQGSFKGVSRKIAGCSERPERVIQRRYKVLKRSSKDF